MVACQKFSAVSSVEMNSGKSVLETSDIVVLTLPGYEGTPSQYGVLLDGLSTVQLISHCSLIVNISGHDFSLQAKESFVGN